MFCLLCCVVLTCIVCSVTCSTWRCPKLRYSCSLPPKICYKHFLFVCIVFSLLFVAVLVHGRKLYPSWLSTSGGNLTQQTWKKKKTRTPRQASKKKGNYKWGRRTRWPRARKQKKEKNMFTLVWKTFWWRMLRGLQCLWTLLLALSLLASIRNRSILRFQACFLSCAAQQEHVCDATEQATRQHPQDVATACKGLEAEDAPHT